MTQCLFKIQNKGAIFFFSVPFCWIQSKKNVWHFIIFSSKSHLYAKYIHVLILLWATRLGKLTGTQPAFNLFHHLKQRVTAHSWTYFGNGKSSHPWFIWNILAVAICAAKNLISPSWLILIQGIFLTKHDMHKLILHIQFSHFLFWILVF